MGTELDCTMAKGLRRIEGHLRSIIAMIEEGRSCFRWLAMQSQALGRCLYTREMA